jgi:hypothetical protein
MMVSSGTGCKRRPPDMKTVREATEFVVTEGKRLVNDGKRKYDAYNEELSKAAKKKMKCVSCMGRGYHWCNACGGTGQVRATLYDPYAGGFREVVGPCTMCIRGKIACNSCWGTGFYSGGF